MSRSSSAGPEKMLRLCDGVFGDAVSAVMSFSRVLWSLANLDTQCGKAARPHRSLHRVIDERDLLESLPTGIHPIVETIIEILRTRKLCWGGKDGRLCFRLDALRPLTIARQVLEDLRPDPQLRYFVLHDTRKHYRCEFSPATTRAFHLLGDVVNLLRGSEHICYTPRFVSCLRDTLKASPGAISRSESMVDLFIECCRTLNYIVAAPQLSHVDIRVETVDAEFLLSNLFGMPTGIPGFDELFGGGGLMLAETGDWNRGKNAPGRTSLIMGRFGTGKTLLSLQLAAEVARKGGLGWVMPLEQSIDACLHSAESMRAIPDDGSVQLAFDVASAVDVLMNPKPGRGALVILRTTNSSYEYFLDALRDNAAHTHNYPLSLIVADPINTLDRAGRPVNELRCDLRETLELITSTGTNVLLVAEENRGSDDGFLFEQNVADTVIRLSTRDERNYQQRFFEIRKSRLQRELRGEHPFAIRAGAGIWIMPSPAAVSSRIQSRRRLVPNKPVEFGLRSVDEILGMGSLKRGDVVVFSGRTGSLKTQLAMLFLLGSDGVSDRSTDEDQSEGALSFLRSGSLLVAARDDEQTVRNVLSQDFVERHYRDCQPRKPLQDIRICSLPDGYVQPGYIFQRLEAEFLEARLHGCSIDRVVVDNIAHWEKTCPFLRDDAIFGSTLVEFLRRNSVTTVLVCDDISQNDPSFVQKSVIDSADCVIQFDSLDWHGSRRVIMRVMQTREMKHHKEWFELALGNDGLSVKPIPSLLRVDRSGESKPIDIRFLLHSETDAQNSYNEAFTDAITASVSRTAKKESVNQLYMSKAMGLSSYSAIDELQIMQIDEFELTRAPRNHTGERTLHHFSADLWDSDEWDDLLPHLRERVCQDKGFVAVPFYENISLLSYRKGLLPARATKRWEDLATACTEWELHNPDPCAVFFDFPRVTSENYNCLFFEILLSLAGEPKLQPEQGRCPLQEWLRSEEALVAARLYRQLARRACAAETSAHIPKSKPDDVGTIRVNSNAIVCRHWYSTLNQMMTDLSPDQRHSISVVALPGKHTIAGEWYLGIPAYSSAPDVGLEIIKMLTTHEAEANRLHLGIGLPTRATYYSARVPGIAEDPAISPHFSAQVGRMDVLMRKAFRRSQFGCYPRLSRVIAHHLQRVIEVSNKGDIDQKIKGIINFLVIRLDLLLNKQDCSECLSKRECVGPGKTGCAHRG